MRYLEEPRGRDLMLAGMLLAASVYVRPVGYFLPIVVAVGLLVWVILRGERKIQLMTQIASFLTITMLITGMWQIRNRRETSFSGFSGISSIDMYFYLATSVVAAQEHVPFVELQRQMGYLDDRVYFALHPEQRTWTVAQRLNYMHWQAERVLVGHPLTYLRIHLNGMIRVLLDPGATIYLKFFKLYADGGGILGNLVDRGVVSTMMPLMVRKPLVFWSNAVLLPVELLYLLCASAVLFSRRLINEPTVIAAVLMLCYYVLISGGPMAVPRYRHPAMPIICVLAGYGLCLALDHLQSQKRSIFNSTHREMVVSDLD